MYNRDYQMMLINEITTKTSGLVYLEYTKAFCVLH
jgi:hypothetical protein